MLDAESTVKMQNTDCLFDAVPCTSASSMDSTAVWLLPFDVCLMGSYRIGQRSLSEAERPGHFGYTAVHKTHFSEHLQ
jgi:hypothetical protein